jgi:NarL family two-component system sensor histidine kinase LiaS
LRWKLALTYTLVTVAALLVVEVGILGISQFIEPVLLPPLPARAAVDYVAPQARSFLETQPMDIQGLNAWLLRTAIQGFAITTPDGQDAWMGFEIAFEGDRQMMIFDCQGEMLSSLPSESMQGQEPFSMKNDIPGIAKLWPIALSGETDPEQLYELSENNYLTAVAPVLDNKGGCLGVVVTAGTVASDQITDAPTLLSILGASAIGITVAAALIGLVFGFIAARNLSRRIDDLALVADSWSKGDFKIFAHDKATDELGQLADRLNRMAEQLQNLLHTRQEVAILEERNRLARDLHDSVKQKAFGLAAQLGTIRHNLPEDIEAAMEHLEQAEQLTSQIRSELTGLIQELHPIDMHVQDFGQRLNSYLDEWSHRHGIRASLQLNIRSPLTPSQDKAYWMVLQEALSNIAQHSEATQVDVEFTRQGSRIELVIQDNGRGFNAEEVIGQGLGLLSMHERMEVLGGQLSIESIQGDGTRILASSQAQETS